jgi:hypothetical protein
VAVNCADAWKVIIGPKYVAWVQDAEPSERTFGTVAELHRRSDDELHDDRDRRVEELSELTRSTVDATDNEQLIADITREVELLTNELVRRARARHPSSQR